MPAGPPFRIFFSPSLTRALFRLECENFGFIDKNNDLVTYTEMAGKLQDSELQKHRVLNLDAFYFPNFVTVSSLFKSVMSESAGKKKSRSLRVEQF